MAKGKKEIINLGIDVKIEKTDLSQVNTKIQELKTNINNAFQSLGNVAGKGQILDVQKFVSNLEYMQKALKELRGDKESYVPFKEAIEQADRLLALYKELGITERETGKGIDMMSDITNLNIAIDKAHFRGHRVVKLPKLEYLKEKDFKNVESVTFSPEILKEFDEADALVQKIKTHINEISYDNVRQVVEEFSKLSNLSTMMHFDKFSKMFPIDQAKQLDEILSAMRNSKMFSNPNAWIPQTLFNPAIKGGQETYNILEKIIAAGQEATNIAHKTVSNALANAANQTKPPSSNIDNAQKAGLQKLLDALEGKKEGIQKATEEFKSIAEEVNKPLTPVSKPMSDQAQYNDYISKIRNSFKEGAEGRSKIVDTSISPLVSKLQNMNSLIKDIRSGKIEVNVRGNVREYFTLVHRLQFGIINLRNKLLELRGMDAFKGMRADLEALFKGDFAAKTKALQHLSQIPGMYSKNRQLNPFGDTKGIMTALDVIKADYAKIQRIAKGFKLGGFNKVMKDVPTINQGFDELYQTILKTSGAMTSMGTEYVQLAQKLGHETSSASAPRALRSAYETRLQGLLRYNEEKAMGINTPIKREPDILSQGKQLRLDKYYKRIVPIKYTPWEQQWKRMEKVLASIANKSLTQLDQKVDNLIASHNKPIVIKSRSINASSMIKMWKLIEQKALALSSTKALALRFKDIMLKQVPIRNLPAIINTTETRIKTQASNLIQSKSLALRYKDIVLKEFPIKNLPAIIYKFEEKIKNKLDLSGKAMPVKMKLVSKSDMFNNLYFNILSKLKSSTKPLLLKTPIRINPITKEINLADWSKQKEIIYQDIKAKASDLIGNEPISVIARLKKMAVKLNLTKSSFTFIPPWVSVPMPRLVLPANAASTAEAKMRQSVKASVKSSMELMNSIVRLNTLTSPINIYRSLRFGFKIRRERIKTKINEAIKEADSTAKNIKKEFTLSNIKLSLRELATSFKTNLSSALNKANSGLERFHNRLRGVQATTKKAATVTNELSKKLHESTEAVDENGNKLEKHKKEVEENKKAIKGMKDTTNQATSAFKGFASILTIVSVTILSTLIAAVRQSISETKDLMLATKTLEARFGEFNTNYFKELQQIQFMSGETMPVLAKQFQHATQYFDNSNDALVGLYFSSIAAASGLGDIYAILRNLGAAQRGQLSPILAKFFGRTLGINLTDTSNKTITYGKLLEALQTKLGSLQIALMKTPWWVFNQLMNQSKQTMRRLIEGPLTDLAKIFGPIVDSMYKLNKLLAMTSQYTNVFDKLALTAETFGKSVSHIGDNDLAGRLGNVFSNLYQQESVANSQSNDQATRSQAAAQALKLKQQVVDAIQVLPGWKKFANNMNISNNLMSISVSNLQKLVGAISDAGDNTDYLSDKFKKAQATSTYWHTSLKVGLVALIPTMLKFGTRVLYMIPGFQRLGVLSSITKTSLMKLNWIMALIIATFEAVIHNVGGAGDAFKGFTAIIGNTIAAIGMLITTFNNANSSMSGMSKIFGIIKEGFKDAFKSFGQYVSMFFNEFQSSISGFAGLILLMTGKWKDGLKLMDLASKMFHLQISKELIVFFSDVLSLIDIFIREVVTIVWGPLVGLFAGIKKLFSKDSFQDIYKGIWDATAGQILKWAPINNDVIKKKLGMDKVLDSEKEIKRQEQSIFAEYFSPMKGWNIQGIGKRIQEAIQSGTKPLDTKQQQQELQSLGQLYMKFADEYKQATSSSMDYLVFKAGEDLAQYAKLVQKGWITPTQLATMYMKKLQKQSGESLHAMVYGIKENPLVKELKHVNGVTFNQKLDVNKTLKILLKVAQMEEFTGTLTPEEYAAFVDNVMPLIKEDLMNGTSSATELTIPVTNKGIGTQTSPIVGIGKVHKSGGWGGL